MEAPGTSQQPNHLCKLNDDHQLRETQVAHYDHYLIISTCTTTAFPLTEPQAVQTNWILFKYVPPCCAAVVVTKGAYILSYTLHVTYIDRPGPAKTIGLVLSPPATHLCCHILGTCYGAKQLFAALFPPHFRGGGIHAKFSSN